MARRSKIERLIDDMLQKARFIRYTAEMYDYFGSTCDMPHMNDARSIILAEVNELREALDKVESLVICGKERAEA